MKLYRDVLREAWRVTLHHPSLWLFGVFASFIFSTGGEIDRYLSYINALVTQGNFLNPTFWQQRVWFIPAYNLWQLLYKGDTASWVFVVLLCLAVLIVIKMIALAEGALIYAAAQPTRVSFIEAFKVGWNHTIVLFFLNVVTYLVVVAPALTIVAILTHNQLPQLYVVMTSCVVLLPLVLGVSGVSRYAAHEIVLHNRHLGQAIKRAWQLWRQHWLVTTEMALTVFVLNLVLNIAVVLASAIVLAPYFFMSVFSLSDTPEVLVSKVYDGFFIWVLLYGLITLLFAAIFTVWQWAAWTRLYQRLLQSKPTATLVNVLKKTRGRKST